VTAACCFEISAVKDKMKKLLKRVLLGGIVLFMALWSVVTVGGVYFTVRPRPAAIEDVESIAGYAVEPVFIDTADAVRLSAWHVAGEPNGRAVILLAGIDANRYACMGRAEFYLKEGYSVLLPDLRASGKSGGDAVTLGWCERMDLVACYAFLKGKGYDFIGVNGISLGAATICYALPELPDLSFLVLESCYDTIPNAVCNRLAMYHAPPFIAWPFYLGLSYFTGAPAWRLAPVDFVKYCEAPALIMAGDAEKELKVSETQAIFEQCDAPKKHLHLFKEGRHQDFLSKYLMSIRSCCVPFLRKLPYHRKGSRFKVNPLNA
jgi:uncharacterized protein